MTTTKATTKLSRIGYVPIMLTNRTDEPLGWEGLASELTKLPHRYFWARLRGNHTPALLRTLDMPDLEETQENTENRQAMRESVGRRFGKLKRDILQNLEKHQAQWELSGNGRQPVDGNQTEEGIPFWGK